VTDFAIGKAGFGEIRFNVPGYNVTDVSRLDLTKQLVFDGQPGKMTSVSLYPDAATKPFHGVELNKPATITVFFTKSWTLTKIRRVVEAQEDTRFISYDSATKELVFQVQHFSTYGFNDDEEADAVAAGEQLTKETSPHFRLLQSGQSVSAWAGAQCTIEVDSCGRSENDCDKKRSTCQHVGAGVHECLCHVGYETKNGGKLCTTIQECLSSPCMNGGNCIDGACTDSACAVQWRCECLAVGLVRNATFRWMSVHPIHAKMVVRA